MTCNKYVMFVKWMYLVLLASKLSASTVEDSVDFCSPSKFSCGDGGCVSADLVCDGSRDCADGGDELDCGTGLRNLSSDPVLRRSKRHDSACRKSQWTCLDGSCIALRIKCDGIADCPDGSDESSAVCQETLPQTGKCKLPEYPANGKYTTDVSNAKPGDAYDSVTMNITCKQGFGVDGSNSVSCRDGLWTEKIPTCKITHCYLPTHHSVEYRCLVFEPYRGSRVCKEYEPVGTVVLPHCRSPIYYYDAADHRINNSTSFDYMKCNEGSWNYIAKCKPECGTVTPAGVKLIIGGVSAKRAEVPWHAGIYTKTKRPYMQICGGSLIKNNIVVSAAHCFWDSIVGQLPAADYAVAVGKLYRPWINTRDEAQQSDVKELHLSDHFQGSAANFQDDIAVVIVKDPFDYTAHIRPVCVDFDFSFQEDQLELGHKGKVAGWGLTAENGVESQVLKVIDLPYITTEQCISESPADFRTYITSDKMCAGYKESGKALCKGDSGGGLAFPGIKDSGIERYYLRGIVSTAPNNINLCNANTFTTFTLLLKHEHFVKYWMAEGPKRKTESRGAARAIPINRNVVRTFVDRAASPPAPFHHLTVDRNTGRVYIGALNRIHLLTPDLERTQWTVTGPVMSSNDCFVCPANYTLELADNASKALVIDYVKNRLITCGSVYQGMCSVRKLSDISVVREVQAPVAANDVASSTVAFIAPGPPGPQSPTTRVLYVAASFTDNSRYNVDVPAVCSRSLDDDRLFMIAGTTVRDTSISVFSSVRGSYPINYVYGFSSEGFSYFLTTQLKGIGSTTYHSKLVRVCHGDEHYYSYTEIPMTCTAKGGGDYEYNLVQAAFVGRAGPNLAAELGITTAQDVLFAVFSQSETINSNKPSNRSALCVYSLKAIRRMFTQNINRCYSGVGSTGLDFITPSYGCISTKLKLDEDFCGFDLNTPLGGELPVEAVSAVEFDAQLTAVAATARGDHTVVFAGAAHGHLKKILVENSSSAFEYGDIDVDEGLPIHKDLIFDTRRTHLYVMTERRVSKVRVQECGEYKSCSACLGARDPYCGWRPLENECSLRPEGHNVTRDSVQWMSYSGGRCTIITKVTPNQLQRSTPMTLDLLVENLPTYEGQLECAFTAFGRTLATDATRTRSGVSCAAPRAAALPAVPDTETHFTARLAVRVARGPDIAATEFKFFDCNSHTSCTKCVTSPFDCDWCLVRNRCTHDVVEYCRNDDLVTSATKMNYNSGSSFCPGIDATDNQILVPYGVYKSINLKVNIRSPSVVQSRFVCRFNIEGRVINANGRLLADTVYCDRVEFTYASLAPNITASLAVVWGGSKTLDNPGNARLVIYRCSLAATCGECLARPEKFECGWCRGAGADKCEVRDLCDAPGSWSNRTLACPNSTA